MKYRHFAKINPKGDCHHSYCSIFVCRMLWNTCILYHMRCILLASNSLQHWTTLDKVRKLPCQVVNLWADMGLDYLHILYLLWTWWILYALYDEWLYGVWLSFNVLDFQNMTVSGYSKDKRFEQWEKESHIRSIWPRES